MKGKIRIDRIISILLLAINSPLLLSDLTHHHYLWALIDLIFVLVNAVLLYKDVEWFTVSEISEDEKPKDKPIKVTYENARSVVIERVSRVFFTVVFILMLVSSISAQKPLLIVISSLMVAFNLFVGSLYEYQRYQAKKAK